MEHKNVPSEVYAIEKYTRRDMAVKEAKQQFAAERGYEYSDVMGTTLQSIPAYGIRVYVCHEPSLWDNR